MTNLERLIIRINNPPQVPSHEDVLDTVKQYWDDVSSKYWSDTDDEIVEELGITKIALAELLDPTRHTFQYANIGGISSVRGYDHGADWFVVMFSDGSRYLYTTKSTTPESLGFMRKYAIEGKGLNSYIMRMQRMNYAGRNVKGEILIKPGMEQFNPEGYKRLTLIKAYEMTNVSNENFFETIKKFLGIPNKKMEYNLSKSTTYNHGGFARAMKREFGDKNWLAKQTFIKGEISGSGISEHVGVGGKADIFKTIEANNKFKVIRKAWDDELKRYFSETKSIREKYKDGPFTDATYDAMTAALSKITKPKLPEKLVPKEWFTDKVTGEITALTEDEIFKAANEIGDSLEDLWVTYDTLKGVDHNNFVDLDRYWISLAHADNPSKSKLDSSYPLSKWVDLALSIDSLHLYWSSKEYYRCLNEYRAVFLACAKWIDRSIKGNVAVEHFNTLISAAGPDGLDPIAKELLSINLSLVKAS